MPDFRAVLIAHGLDPREIVPGTKWVRCATEDKPRKRNGAYMLAADGRMGWFKNFATDNSFNVWRADGEVSAANACQVQTDAADARRREAAYRQTAIDQCRAYWAGLAPFRGGHRYLASKKLDMLGCGQLRVDGSLLVIPILRDCQVMSVQSIAEDGRKRFRSGCPVKGGVYVLDRTGASLTCFVEGFATGLAVFSAIKQARVIVCFDSGNLVEVASHFTGRGLGVVCADNDHQTALSIGSNPGLDAGLKAAERLGCGLAYPEGIRGSDWADVLLERDDARRWIARQVMKKARPFARREGAMA